MRHHQPLPDETDGEASHLGPDAAWLDDPDHDAFNDESECEPLPDQPFDYDSGHEDFQCSTADPSPQPAANGDTAMTHTWMGDSGFDNAVLDRWRAAEAWCGLKESAAKSKHKGSEPTVVMPSLPLDANFVPCSAFVASAHNLVFKKGTDDMASLGYYRDQPPSKVTCTVFRVVISIAFRVPLLACNPALTMQTDLAPQPAADKCSKRARRARTPNDNRK